MILSGILLSPNGEPLASTSVRLIAAITSAQVLQSIQSVIVTGVNGEYSFSCPNGRYRVQASGALGMRDIGMITITDDTVTSSLNELLMIESSASHGDPVIAQIGQVIAGLESLDAAVLSASESAALAQDSLSDVVSSIDSISTRISYLPSAPDLQVSQVNPPVLFSDIGLFSKTIGTWKPSSDTAGAVVALKYSEYFIDTSAGSLLGVSHGIADFIRVELNGGGQVSQTYVRESRYGIKDGTLAGTIYSNTHVLEADSDSSGAVSKVVLEHLPDASSSATWAGEIKAEYLDPRFVLENKGRFLTSNGYLSPPASMHQPGRWYTSIGASAGPTGGVSQGLVVAAPPIRISRRTTITKLAIEVTAASASCVASIGLYRSGSDDLPGSLLVSANVSASTTGIKIANVSITLDAGLYYPAVVCSGAASNPELRHSAIDFSRMVELYGGDSASPFESDQDGYLYTVSSGVLPSSFGTPVRFPQSIVPMISISS